MLGRMIGCLAVAAVTAGTAAAQERDTTELTRLQAQVETGMEPRICTENAD